MKNKITSTFLCIIFCFIMFYSAAFVAKETQHECVGKECHVCVEVHSCLSFLTNMSHIAVMSSIFLSVIQNIMSVGHIADLLKQIPTLVTLKVKLTN